MLRWKRQGFGRKVSAFIFIAVALLPTSAAALDVSTYKILSTPFYDPSSSSACDVNVDPSLSGDGAVQQAFNFFVSQGLSAVQAAGIVGNLRAESGVVPTKIQGGSNSQNPLDAGSAGWGIAQWTPANTKVPGIVSATGLSSPVYDLSTQLQMLWAQLNGKAGSYSETTAGNDLKAAATIEDAVRAFLGDLQIGGHYFGFERPKDEGGALPVRLAMANQIIQQYGNSGGSTISVNVGAGSCNPAGPGQDTKYVDGFTVYNQSDESWGNKPFGTSTIAVAGCGPSAMAMIITTLTGQSVTPDQTAAYADAQGLYVAGEGSSWSLGPKLAPHWGLSAKLINADTANISAALQSGSLVLVAGRGPAPFTDAGHFLVIRAVTADGQWLVGDSGHTNTSTVPWSPLQILAGIIQDHSQGSVYAISK